MGWTLDLMDFKLNDTNEEVRRTEKNVVKENQG